MDRNQRSRRQKSANGSYAQQSRRSMGSRLGLEKRNAPRPKAPPEKAAPAPHAPPRQRPAQEINPQKAGYRPGTPRRTRRVTQAEIIRAKRRRRLLGALGVLAVLAVGAFVSINLLFRFEVIGRENLKAVRDGRAYVIAPNHIANLDPVLIAITIFDWKRLRILAKEELFKNPLAGWFLRCMGAVSIERGKGDTTTVEKLTNECKNGTGIMIFPEGTRTKTGKLGVIKSGALVIAAAAGADMLPVRIIYGTKDGRLHLFCKLRIVFGEPIPAADLQIRDQSHKMAELRRMKNLLRDELEQLLADNAFAVRLAETAAEEPAAPDDKPQLPE